MLLKLKVDLEVLELNVCVFMCIFACIYVHACMCICVCVCVYMSVKHKHALTDDQLMSCGENITIEYFH